MKKDYLYILGLTLLASVLCVLLFNLPKQVLKEKNREMAVEETQRSKEEFSTQSEHSNISEKQLSRIKNLRRSYLLFSDKEKKRIFADSLAMAYITAGVNDSAEAFIVRFQQFGETIEDNMRAADLYYKLFNFVQPGPQREKYSAKAKELYKNIMNTQPSLAVKTRLGVLLVKGSKAPMEGILLLRTVIDENPKFVEALFSLGEFSMITQQYDKAIQRFETILEVEPKNIESLIYLGDCQLAINDKKSAAKSYNQALGLAKGDDFFEELLNNKIEFLNN